MGKYDSFHPGGNRREPTRTDAKRALKYKESWPSTPVSVYAKRNRLKQKELVQMVKDMVKERGK